MTPTAPERRRRPSRSRAGFTLVELLVVLVILSLLIALLLPAIAGAIRKARGAAVQAEINQLAQALAAFKSQFGDYPPSRVILNESGGLPSGSTLPVPSGGNPTGTVADITIGQLADRTATAMRKFWPRAQFSTSGPRFSPGSTEWYDFNGTGSQEAVDFVLQGHECLVFFLGGIPLNVSGPISVIGFGKSPTNPFSNGVQGSSMYSGNRTPPMFEFKSERLQLTLLTSLPTGSGYSAFLSATSRNPGYIDSLDGQGNKQSFYAYFSTNVGNGYDPNDVNLGIDSDGNGGTPLTLAFFSGQPTFSSGGRTQFVESPSPNPYATGVTYLPPPPAFAVPYQNPQTFQIISPGTDGMYGIGGAYMPTATTALPYPTLPAGGSATTSSDAGVRNLESDNLTNFHNGTLQ